MLLFAPALAAVPPPIVNGEHTTLYPQVVMLRHADPGFSTVYICSGTLVAPRWILTAAHCVVDEGGITEMRVFVGDAWTADAEELVPVEWYPHPDYYVSPDGWTIDADVGLVHLAEPLDLAPIPLNDAPLGQDDVGEVLRWVGWGASDDYAYDAGTLKRYADMPIVGFEDEILLAWDEGGAATCGGDSGGAVLRLAPDGSPTLVAAHTFGRDDDGTLCAGSTSGDTMVDVYLDWIEAEIASDEEVDDTGAGDTGAGEDTAGRDGGDGGGEAAEGCGCAAGTGDAARWMLVALAFVVRRARRGPYSGSQS